MMQRKILILASGGGSNAKAIIEHFERVDAVEVRAIISNKTNAGVHDVAANYNIPSYTFDKKERTSGVMSALIHEIDPDLIVLAGYLLKISPSLIENFPNKIINIHPALLPKFGGKGMYGMNVHKAVVMSQERQSGITIHFVNENYDEGLIIKQVSCIIDPEDTAEVVQKKVLKLEHEHYPKVIEKLLNL